MLYIEPSADDERPLPIFVFPHMPSLAFLAYITAFDWPADLFWDPHARSSSFRFLTRLELADLHLSANELLPFLNTLPTLAILALRYCICVQDRLFEAFTYDLASKSAEIVLPTLLASLTLEASINFINGHFVAEMVESLRHAAESGETTFPLLKGIHLGLDGMRFDGNAERCLDRENGLHWITSGCDA
ncbi:hypothetical protein DFH09DRAFT_1305758 [Mycena vulgaris]|nr:hypothetical protein DFH09DRAFT_1305758 [Mycena vulgaris]